MTTLQVKQPGICTDCHDDHGWHRADCGAKLWPCKTCNWMQDFNAEVEITVPDLLEEYKAYMKDD